MQTIELKLLPQMTHQKMFEWMFDGLKKRLHRFLIGALVLTHTTTTSHKKYLTKNTLIRPEFSRTPGFWTTPTGFRQR
jgi:hypothetical protein